MRVYLFLPLFIVVGLSNGRPQEISNEGWKPIENESQTQRLRYLSQIRDNQYNNVQNQPFVSPNLYTYPHNNNLNSNGSYMIKLKKIIPEKINVDPRKYAKIQYKISNITVKTEPLNKIQADKEKDIFNNFIPSNTNDWSPINATIKTSSKVTQSQETKHWPDTEIQTMDDIHNYNTYISSSTTSPPKKPIVHNVFTKISDRPIGNGDNDNKWFEIKMKPLVRTPETNMFTIPDSLPVNVVENSHSYPPNNIHLGNTITLSPESTVLLGDNSLKRPINTALNVIQNNDEYPSNNIHIGTTVTLSPESTALLDNTNGLERPANPIDPCPQVSITSNTIFNKEACPDLDIVINNHIITNDNVFTNDVAGEGSPESVPVEADYDDIQADASEEDYVQDEIADSAELEDVAAEDVAEEAAGSEGAAQSGGQPGSSGTQSGDSSQGSLPQLPELPGLPENDNDDSGGLFDSGILDFLNPLSNPLITLIGIPLFLIATGTLGISTFFIPWAVFPTVFLARKAKYNDVPYKETENPIIRPDGWFWHNHYQTWTSLNQLDREHSSEVIQNRVFQDDSVANIILRLIDEFGKKYISHTNKSWKRRKKS